MQALERKGKKFIVCACCRRKVLCVFSSKCNEYSYQCKACNAKTTHYQLVRCNISKEFLCYFPLLWYHIDRHSLRSFFSPSLVCFVDLQNLFTNCIIVVADINFLAVPDPDCTFLNHRINLDQWKIVQFIVVVCGLYTLLYYIFVFPL